MAVTLLDYKNGVAAKGFDSVTQATALLDAVNSARRDFVNERRWGFLQALGNTTLTTTLGVPTVATSTITDLLYIDAVRMQQGTTGYDLQPTDLQKFRRLENLDRVNGLPRWWTAPPGASPAAIRLGPRPDGVYTLVLDYVKTVADMATDADPETIIPLACKTAVVWKACEHLAFRTRQPDALSLAERKYGLELAKLTQAEGLGQRQESTQVVDSGYWDGYEDVVGGWL